MTADSADRNAHHVSIGKGIGPPRFNSAWLAVRRSSMADHAIFEATGVFPHIVAEMRDHWAKLREMGKAPLYKWDAEKARAAEMVFHVIDRSPSAARP